MRIVRETGKPIAQVARELGLNEGTLGNWVNGDRRKRQGDGALTESERDELNRLRRENAELNCILGSLVLVVGEECRHSEVGWVGGSSVDLAEFVVGAGDADLESFDFAEPANWTLLALATDSRTTTRPASCMWSRIGRFQVAFERDGDA